MALVNATASRCRHCHKNIVWDHARRAWHTGAFQSFVTCEKSETGHASVNEMLELESQISLALAILNPSVPGSGLADACRQVKQALVSEQGNVATLEGMVANARKKALEDARVALLKEWDADRGDGERRPDYSKATWQKAMDALATCK